MFKITLKLYSQTNTIIAIGIIFIYHNLVTIYPERAKKQVYALQDIERMAITPIEKEGEVCPNTT